MLYATEKEEGFKLDDLVDQVNSSTTLTVRNMLGSEGRNKEGERRN